MNWQEKLIEAKPLSISISGAPGTGKTALAYTVIEQLRRDGRKVFVLQHPKPQLLEERGYHLLMDIEQMPELEDCILWLDEPQLHLRTYDHHANEALQIVLSLARQKNITIVLSTSETRFITRGLEAYIDVWMVKDQEPELVKQGSMIRKIIKEHCFLNWRAFSCKQDEFLLHCRKLPVLNGRHTSTLPNFWNREYSCPYKKHQQQERNVVTRWE